MGQRKRDANVHHLRQQSSLAACPGNAAKQAVRGKCRTSNRSHSTIFGQEMSNRSLFFLHPRSKHVFIDY